MSDPHPLEVLELDYIHFKFFDNYVFSTIQDGVAFTKNNLEEVSAILNDFYKGNPFISIALRNYDYTIAPTCFHEDSIVNGLLGIGVVCYGESAYNTSIFEKAFYKGIYEVFYSLEECIQWAQQLYNDSIKKAGL